MGLKGKPGVRACIKQEGADEADQKSNSGEFLGQVHVIATEDNKGEPTMNGRTGQRIQMVFALANSRMP